MSSARRNWIFFLNKYTTFLPIKLCLSFPMRGNINDLADSTVYSGSRWQLLRTGASCLTCFFSLLICGSVWAELYWHTTSCLIATHKSSSLQIRQGLEKWCAASVFLAKTLIAQSRGSVSPPTNIHWWRHITEQGLNLCSPPPSVPLSLPLGLLLGGLDTHLFL